MRDRLVDAMANLEDEARKLGTFEIVFEKLREAKADAENVRKAEIEVTRQRVRVNAASDRLRKVMRDL